MTYYVFGKTLNLAQSINSHNKLLQLCGAQNGVARRRRVQRKERRLRRRSECGADNNMWSSVDCCSTVLLEQFPLVLTVF